MTSPAPGPPARPRAVTAPVHYHYRAIGPDSERTLSPTAIVLPAGALVALTAIVWVRLYHERIGEIRRRRIRPQQLATRHGAAETLQDTRASDHFRNLFEVPVLFYALCALAAASGQVTPLLIGLA